MFRIACVLTILAGFAAVAGAQPRPLPLSPGVMPASPFGPGTPFPAGPIVQKPGSAPITYFPVALPTGWGTGWAYQTWSPWTGFGYTYGGLVQPGFVPQQQAIVEPARPAEPTIVLAQEFPATLSLQFPATAEVWLDGAKVKGDADTDRVLTSPVLKPGQQHTFNLKARWQSGGKTYETKRAVTLGPGDKSRLLILSGDEVR